MAGNKYSAQGKACLVPAASRESEVRDWSLLAVMGPDETLPGYARGNAGNVFQYHGAGPIVFERSSRARELLIAGQSTRRRHAGPFYLRADELNDLVHRRPGLENRGYASLLQAIDILVGDDASHDHDHIVHLVLLEQVHHAGHDRIVRARKESKARSPAHLPAAPRSRSSPASAATRCRSLPCPHRATRER